MIEIKKRTKFEWRKLYIRRGILVFLNFGFIVLLSRTIIWVNIVNKDLENWTRDEFLPFIGLGTEYAQYAQLAMTLVVTLCNGLINPITKLIT